MDGTGVQQESRAKAVEIKSFAVEATIEEEVHWCSQHTYYIRACRTSYYFSDVTRSKSIDELARNELLKNTPYKPRENNISFD